MNRFLIVNADDFGLTCGVNQGVVRAYRDGILSSASLMVRSPAAEPAAALADGIDLGLHIDLGEWRYRDGRWVQHYHRASTDDAEAVEAEIRDQLAAFLRLTGKTPTHLDSHQHVHLREPVRSVAMRVATELDAPLRALHRNVRYCGDFYGQSGTGVPCRSAISVESLIQLLATIPEGITELACHPGEDRQLDSPYAAERLIEVASLCDVRVRRAIESEGIQLSSFADLRRTELQSQAGSGRLAIQAPTVAARQS